MDSVFYFMVGAHILFQTISADLMSLDLHGRGYSEIPEKGSDINLYIIQLALLLQYVGWESAYVVGFSMVISNSTYAIPVGVDDSRVAVSRAPSPIYFLISSMERWCSSHQRD